LATDEKRFVYSFHEVLIRCSVDEAVFVWSFQTRSAIFLFYLSQCTVIICAQPTGRETAGRRT
jgi:hypothetical protein